MTQLAFESFLTHGIKSLLEFYVGYSFGGASVPGWTHATVCTPRWIGRALRETPGPIVIDNGAFPAFRDGVSLGAEKQIKDLGAAITATGDRLKWAVLPDVVGDAIETRSRSLRALGEIGIDRSSWLAPYQEGADPVEFSAWVLESGIGGAFIGGATKAFKRRSLRQLAGRVPWIHVARISADHELNWAAVLGADSFDSCSPTYGFTKNQTSGRDRNWAASFSRYCVPS